MFGGRTVSCSQVQVFVCKPAKEAFAAEHLCLTQPNFYVTKSKHVADWTYLSVTESNFILW